MRFLSRWGGDEPATQIVLLFLLPFASYLIAEHIGVSGILAAVAAGMTITRSGVMRTAPLAMRLRANSTWAMLEFVFNGMVFLLLGLQLPDILSTSLVAAEADPNVETWMLFTDIILIYAALMLVRFGWLWTMRKLSQRFLKRKPMEFGSWTTRELLISSVAGVRGAITLAGVLSIPLLLPDGNVFPARYELIFFGRRGDSVLAVCRGDRACQFCYVTLSRATMFSSVKKSGWRARRRQMWRLSRFRKWRSVWPPTPKRILITSC
ncbi:Sodium, potassium, lithium and rubidium/H(+) antiporter [Raoultella planticola]|uniref:Sodium, potassium, lithium and rubidium/H(+) antiporter n=1 Tax=Raoultella planticola TaxID=575 RepID=A0A485APK9_RAOPL|nr:Sodium, potassium, lithium and rubidium/H(+) antiporter [Raoultella planticola]